MWNPVMFLPALAAAMCLLATGAATAQADAPRYRIKSLGNIPGGTGMLAWDINEHGDVTGIAKRYRQSDLGFLYHDGRAKVLPLPAGANGATALGLNDHGDAVGQGFFPGGYAPPLLFRHDGSVIDLTQGLEGGFTTGWAVDINNAGWVTGIAWGGPNTGISTFIHDGTHGRALTIPGVERSEPLAINAAGEVLIHEMDGPDYYLYSQGRITRLPQLVPNGLTSYMDFNDVGQLTGNQQFGCCESRPFIAGSGPVEFIPGSGLRAADINNRGWIVGYESDVGSFLYRDGQAYALRDLLPTADASRWNELLAVGVNDAGQITGVGRMQGIGAYRSFVATPVPEASTAALLLAGLGVLGAVARARRPAPVAHVTRCASP